MIGIIPSASKTFEVMGDFNCRNPIEGKLYYDDDGRLYMYSKSNRRSNPSTGYFPVWDGENTYTTKFSNIRNISEITNITLKSISEKIDVDTATDIKFRQRKSTDEEILRPTIQSSDNMFTQVIKSVINKHNWTMLDLFDMTSPKMDINIIDNLYTSLQKISFMRIERWNLWVDIILHLHYELNVFKGSKTLISYKYPENTFDTGIVKYNNIIQEKANAFNKIVRILCIMENISKATLRENTEVDSYTINNMFTTIMSNKALSSQLFSRFIHISGLSYQMKVFNNKKELLVDYKEEST